MKTMADGGRTHTSIPFHGRRLFHGRKLWNIFYPDFHPMPFEKL